MLNIDTSTWKEFYIGELFELKKCKCSCAGDLEEGYETIYIGAKKSNNGFMKFVKKNEKLMSKGNCIIFICDGEGSVGYSNYCDVDFIGSTTVTCGYNKNLNKYIGMFLVTILDLEKIRYSYGRKYSPTLAKTIVKLPQTEEGNPNWKFMEDYIKELWKNSYNTSIEHSKVDLNVEEWKEFELQDLFEKIYKAKAYVKSQLSLVSNIKGVPFISRTETNNGCDVFVEGPIEQFIYEKGNALIIGDTTSTCHYQEYDFICGDHIIVLRAKWLNKYNALFLKTILEQERYKYNYGRAFKMELIKHTVLKLPADADGNPDYLFMENYIKKLQYSDLI